MNVLLILKVSETTPVVKITIMYKRSCLHFTKMQFPILASLRPGLGLSPAHRGNWWDIPRSHLVQRINSRKFVGVMLSSRHKSKQKGSMCVQAENRLARHHAELHQRSTKLGTTDFELCFIVRMCGRGSINVNDRLRHKMSVSQPNNTCNVVPFQTRSEDRRVLATEKQRDNIIRMLDLSKFEKPRLPVKNHDASMCANIAALVLLGLLVFIAKEDFGKLARSNVCAIKSECLN